MNAAMNKALQAEQVKVSLARVGADPAGGSPAEFKSFIASEVKTWERTIKDANIKMDN